MTGRGMDVRRPHRLRRFGLLLTLVIAAACTGGGGEEATDVDPEETAVPGRTDLKPIIEIGVTDWPAARLNVAIAEQLIERRLGYPVTPVEVTDIDAMLTDLERGDLDAVLEIWPSSLDPRHHEVIDAGRVERIGDLGPVGRIGWYVPAYVVDADPSLATWEGYSSPTVAADFATPETAGRGRFLGTDPAYLQADEEIIDALDLPFDVIYSGSDAATVAEVEAAVNVGRPVLLYWWSPTAEITRFDLVSVTLPERDAQCEADIADGRPQACDYAVDPLFKAGAPDLEDRAPDLHAFLVEFALTTEDQLGMLHAVEVEGRPIDEVAAAWITDNQNRWESWFGG